MDTSKSSLSLKFSHKPYTSSTDNSKRIDDSTENYSFFEVNYDDMLVYKLECEIRAMFYSIPRNSLEIASYYFKNLTFDEAHGDIQSKVTSHEKLKSHGKLDLLTFDKSRSLEEEQSVSPLLRTPPLKKRRKVVVSCTFKGSDCIEEPVGCDDGSLSVKIKDELENEVILDDVVSSPTNLSMLLKRKGKSRVKFTRIRNYKEVKDG
uniref:Uncharacterized protein n=1 Tax=Tanacetum cinerariifolium TaxID=118510 RepID=A0A6L2KKX4_TANCI|nr:hypothetical protein [Tanacetum cinerariifolium]